MILRPLFCFEDTKNTGLLIFNSLKQNKLIFNFFVNRNRKKLKDSRKRAKILADNRKSHHPIETLFWKMNALGDSANTDRCTINEDSANFLTSSLYEDRISDLSKPLKD